MPTRREFIGSGSAAALMAAAPAGSAARPAGKKVAIELIATESAPKAIGPYSQAVRAGGTIYASGQIALDPATGNMVAGDFAAQARRVFENLKAVLLGSGASFSNVVRTTVYLTDLANFQQLNAIYAEYFGDHKPARSTVGVAQLPRGAMVEIDVIAVA